MEDVYVIWNPEVYLFLDILFTECNICLLLHTFLKADLWYVFFFFFKSVHLEQNVSGKNLFGQVHPSENSVIVYIQTL